MKMLMLFREFFLFFFLLSFSVLGYSQVDFSNLSSEDIDAMVEKGISTLNGGGKRNYYKEFQAEVKRRHTYHPRYLYPFYDGTHGGDIYLDGVDTTFSDIIRDDILRDGIFVYDISSPYRNISQEGNFIREDINHVIISLRSESYEEELLFSGMMNLLMGYFGHNNSTFFKRFYRVMHYYPDRGIETSNSHNNYLMADRYAYKSTLYVFFSDYISGLGDQRGNRIRLSTNYPDFTSEVSIWDKWYEFLYRSGPSYVYDFRNTESLQFKDSLYLMNDRNNLLGLTQMWESMRIGTWSSYYNISHLDTIEQIFWFLDKFYPTLLHEFGHTMGLEHSSKGVMKARSASYVTAGDWGLTPKQLYLMNRNVRFYMYKSYFNQHYGKTFYRLFSSNLDMVVDLNGYFHNGITHFSVQGRHNHRSIYQSCCNDFLGQWEIDLLSYSNVRLDLDNNKIETLWTRRIEDYCSRNLYEMRTTLKEEGFSPVVLYKMTPGEKTYSDNILQRCWDNDIFDKDIGDYMRFLYFLTTDNENYRNKNLSASVRDNFLNGIYLDYLRLKAEERYFDNLIKDYSVVAGIQALK